MSVGTGGPTKVAILGGGVSALAAAFELSDPRHGDAFDVTIHQLGWRLGGKCASGRDMDEGFRFRIKEHGPHIFFGFYDNAFALLREAYAALPPDPARAFNTIEEALAPQNAFATIEEVGDKWLPWVLEAPKMPGEPGEPPLTGAELLRRILGWTKQGIDGLNDKAIAAELARDGSRLAQAAIDAIAALAEHLLADPLLNRGVVVALRLQQRWLHDLWRHLASLSDDARRICILIDLGLTTAIGGLVDGLLFPTKERVAAANDIEYSAWLTNHGARLETVQSSVVRALYDTVFAYPSGDIAQPPNVEAGSAFLTQRAIIAYHGSILWKMGAGTGDVVAAPIFEALRARGVKFEFFHRVDALIPAADGTEIAQIRIGRQATVTTPPYEPLIQVTGPAAKRLAAWPDRPLYDRLDEGPALKAQKVDLESHWTTWPDPAPPLVLDRAAGDFDIVIAAIPPAALRLIAPDPTPRSWIAMFDNIASVQTCSWQLWMDRTLEQTGWTALADPTLCGFDACQLDTWFDASDVLPWEGRSGGVPAQMAILCGAMRTPPAMPPGSDHGFPDRAQEEAYQLGAVFAQASAPLWPGLRAGPGFDMNALNSPDNARGEARLRQQYWTAAINPADRYVQTLTGTSRFRLAANASGYRNLFFCGDWIDYGFNLGCFEGAIISGVQAANAITGDPRPIRNDPYSWR
jgi:uncharacterized protein with NAD-binding domain and iron-sulfur cluster